MRDDVKAWVQKAEDDLMTAKALLKFKKPVPWIICFHAQQAVEKFLKAFLVYNNVPIPKVHDIKQLILMCSRIDTEFKELLKIGIDRLTEYAVEARYPILFEPTLKEAREAVELAEKARNFVLKKLE